MKAIVTIKNEDGTYDEVGMRNRTVLGPYRLESTILRGAREFGKGRTVRIELFGNIIYGDPIALRYIGGK